MAEPESMPISETGKKSSGFTLIEIIAVIVLLGLVAALVFPNYLMSEGRTEVQSIGHLITADFKQVQEDAVINKTEPTVLFNVDGYLYQIGDKGIVRSFKSQGFSFIFPLPEKDADQGGDPEKAPPEPPTLKFKEDGTASGLSLGWQTRRFQGTLTVKDDGTVEWHYDRK